MKLCFATNNDHKLAEIRKALPEMEILGLKAMGFLGEIDEPGATLEENSFIKADFIHKLFSVPCFADDTGLEIEALNGEPGVYSARYAGKGCSFEDNVQLVLKKMEDLGNRNGRFRTVITYIDVKGGSHQFDGIVEGEILTSRVGSGGFGYDPIFRPKGYAVSFAEMTMDEKNKISHRGLAVAKLVDYLSNE